MKNMLKVTIFKNRHHLTLTHCAAVIILLADTQTFLEDDKPGDCSFLKSFFNQPSSISYCKLHICYSLWHQQPHFERCWLSHMNLTFHRGSTTEPWALNILLSSITNPLAQNIKKKKTIYSPISRHMGLFVSCYDKFTTSNPYDEFHKRAISIVLRLTIY